MSSAKLVSLGKYVEDMKRRLSGEVPSKHQNRAEIYHTWLKREIKLAESSIEQIKLNAPAK